MRRRRRSLTLFAAFAVMLIGTMGVVTAMFLRLEAREALAQREADQQERIGLALWRMESAFAPLLARESARPYFHYLSFYPANQAYNRMLQPVAPGEVLVASPLLTTIPEYCALHLQIDGSGQVESPRVPPAEQRTLAMTNGANDGAIADATAELEEFRKIVDRDQLSATARRSMETTLAFRTESTQFPPGLRVGGRGGSRDELEKNKNFDERGARAGGGAPADAAAMPRPAASADLQSQSQQRENATPQQAAKVEYQQRAAAVDVARNQYMSEVAQSISPNDTSCTLISQGVFVPLWLRPVDHEPELLLVRPVTLQQRNIVQCVWLDWKTLRAALEARVHDLLPTARLEPLAGNVDPDCNALASIPAVLRVGAPPAVAQPALSPTRLTLLIAWIGLFGGLSAVGFVVHALAELGERRGRFVSAVTHELRTPLTTFCLYTQMLDDGMVPSEAARREYILTLRRESERLTRIVENVLWYARLSDLRGTARVERIDAAAALDRLLPGLQRRIADGQMELVADYASAAGRMIDVDVQSLERVLMNLVDNACKYVGATADRRVHLWTASDDDVLRVFVADHGPGIPQADAQRIFEPFERSTSSAASGQSGTQGVGLGLALARGLMQEMKGDLRLEDRAGFGAVFTLSIPIRNTAL